MGMQSEMNGDIFTITVRKDYQKGNRSRVKPGGPYQTIKSRTILCSC